MNRKKLLELNENIKVNEIFKNMREKERVTSLTNDEREIIRESWGLLLNYHLQLNIIIHTLNGEIKKRTMIHLSMIIILQ